MKKLILCAVAVLCVAASIFGGYYFFTNDEFQVASTPEEMRPEKAKPTDLGGSLKHRGGAWKDENGEIKRNGIADAISQREKYLAFQMPADGLGDKGDARGMTGVPTNWVPRGPQNLGGRTEEIVFHPKFGAMTTPFNHGIMWAGGSTGGIWKSFNSGNLWYASNSLLQNFTVSCLAIDPGDPTGKTLYAGTGQEDQVIYGGGVFKSTDGGMTWSRMPNTDNVGWSAVNAISVTRVPDGTPEGETIILAAVENFEQDITITSADRGIMRYTKSDPTWRQSTDVLDPYTLREPFKASYVGFDPKDSDRAVAATCYRPHPSLHPEGYDGYCKAWYSTNRGLNWLPSQLRRDDEKDNCDAPDNNAFETCRQFDSIHFAYQKAIPESVRTIYAQYRNGIANDASARTVLSKAVNNGGASFDATGITGFPDGISQGVHAFWVSPQLTGASNSITILTGGAYLYRSNNDAQTDEPTQIANNSVPFSNPVNPHMDFQTVVTDTRYPNNNKRVFVATDGGIFHTNDVTTATGAWGESTPSGWSIRNQGLQNTQYYDVAGEHNSSTGTDLIVGGTHDNGTLRLLGGNTDTTHLLPGDGAMAAVSGTDCFGQIAFPWGHLFRMRSCGSTTPGGPEPIAPQFGPGGFPTPSINLDYPAGHTPIIIDPRVPNRAFLGVKSVWRTDNVKSGNPPYWTLVKSNQGFIASPTATSTGTPSGTPSATPTATPTPIWIRPEVSEIAVAPSDSKTCGLPKTLLTSWEISSMEIYTDQQTQWRPHLCGRKWMVSNRLGCQIAK